LHPILELASQNQMLSFQISFFDFGIYIDHGPWKTMDLAHKVCLLTSTIIDNVPHTKIDIIHHRQSLRKQVEQEKRENKFCQQKTIILFLSHISQD
jgi:hypothetical protein